MQRGEIRVLSETICLGECGSCVGFPQAGNALAVPIMSVQGCPAQATIAAWHLNQFRGIYQMVAGDVLKQKKASVIGKKV